VSRLRIVVGGCRGRYSRAPDSGVLREAAGVRLHLSHRSATGYEGVRRHGAAAGKLFRCVAPMQNSTRPSCLGYFKSAVEAAVCFAKFCEGPEAYGTATRTAHVCRLAASLRRVAASCDQRRIGNVVTGTVSGSRAAAPQTWRRRRDWQSEPRCPAAPLPPPQPGAPPALPGCSAAASPTVQLFFPS
jgi:hypothetical protein